LKKFTVEKKNLYGTICKWSRFRSSFQPPKRTPSFSKHQLFFLLFLWAIFALLELYPGSRFTTLTEMSKGTIEQAAEEKKKGRGFLQVKVGV
jgi:hypothetical protein